MSRHSAALGVMIVGLGIAAVFFADRSTGEDVKVSGNSRLYELRTYTTEPGRLPALHARFRNHTVRLFEKHGMRNEMYWVLTDENLKDNTLIYIVSHESEEAARKSWAAFRADPDWAKVRDESEKDGTIVARVDSLYMTTTDYSPKPRQ